MKYGTSTVNNVVHNSVNKFSFITLPNVTRNMLETSRSNYSNTKLTRLEYITIHDTGNVATSSTAKANSNYCKNDSTESSWHYTIGNDGIYQQLEENIVGWHAGDGTREVTFTDTLIKAENTRVKPTVTIKDSYFWINGKKTIVAVPSDATTNTINELGIYPVIINGTYHLPTTFYNTQFKDREAICTKGGNMNSLGIETTVNNGSDIYLTWQRTSKFVAGLLIKHNLTPDRVLFHNNFSNKPCPMTMINNNLIDEFLDMVYMEYHVQKNYKDYNITFKSNNPNIIDNTGRVIGSGPTKDTLVSYTITVSKGSISKSVTINSLVKGNM